MDLFSPWTMGGLAAVLIGFYVWGFMSEQKAKRAKEAKEKSGNAGAKKT